jgi:penicillin-insensitive murein DD-endopeptidase
VKVYSWKRWIAGEDRKRHVWDLRDCRRRSGLRARRPIARHPYRHASNPREARPEATLNPWRRGSRIGPRPDGPRWRFPWIFAALGAVTSVGCAGVFGFDGTSDSGGWHASGALRHPDALRVAGDGYVVPLPWRERHSNFGSDELVRMVVRAGRAVARAYPGSIAGVGDLSRRSGGGSVEHKSHQSGRDVDIFYYAVNASGRSEAPRGVMFHYDRSGRAVRWSPPQGTARPTAQVPDVRFDIRRNWQLVRALLLDPEVEVQWIFVQRDLAARIIQYGAVEGEDPALMARAAQIVRQPSDSEPHDDHMHVRIYCDATDRGMGCADHGPVRWWKKQWKYMAPPFGRTADIDTTSALLGLLRGRLPVSVGWARLTS